MDDNFAYVLSANPGTLTVINTNDFSVQNEISISGLDSEGAKSGFTISDGLIYVASGYEGVHIYEVATGSHLLNVPLPDGGGADLFANSISVEGNIGYVAAGESVYLLEIERSAGALEASLVGSLELGDFQSINEVNYQNGYLAIASGLGGTKLIRIGNPDASVGYGLLSNEGFDHRFAAWDYEGNVHVDPSWGNETSAAFSGGNKAVTGVIGQHFYANSGSNLNILVNCARRGANNLFVAAKIELINHHTNEVFFTDTLKTEGRVSGDFFDISLSTTAVSDELYVRITDLTENTNGRDFYLNSISITQARPVTVSRKVVKISDFEESNVSNIWFGRNDGTDTEINGVVGGDTSKVYHLKGTDRNENKVIGSFFTRKIDNSIVLEGFSASDVYLNFDIKAEATNGILYVIFQAKDEDGTLRNWVNTVDLTFDGQENISLPVTDFRSNVGNFNADPSRMTLLSLSLRHQTAGIAHEVIVDNFYLSTGTPLD